MKAESWSACRQRAYRVLVFVTAIVVIFMISINGIVFELLYATPMDIEGNLTEVRVRQMPSLDEILEIIKNHTIVKRNARVKRMVRDYTVTVCERSLGVCRRNDLPCGGEYIGGATCNLGLPSVGPRSEYYHSCCAPKTFVPTDTEGNPIVGTEFALAEAVADYWRDSGINVDQENCVNRSDPSCTFSTAGLKAQAVEGLLSGIEESGCDITDLGVIQGTEPGHTHEDYGFLRTAENGLVLAVSGSKCYDRYIKKNLANCQLQLNGRCFEDANGVIYQQLSGKDKPWRIAYPPGI